MLPLTFALILRFTLGLILILLLLVFLLMGSIYTYSLVTDTTAGDAAVVLSAAVFNDEPSPIFEARIKHAVDLYFAGTVQYIIFTGTYRGDRLAESEVARDYALQQGVAPEHIYIETLSRITIENLQQAKLLADEQQFGRLLLVSDGLHMKRAMLMATDLGLNSHPSPIPASQYGGRRSQLRFWLRETWLYSNYLLARLPFRANQPPTHVA
jgi:uncharacterized SAM-binding protein YcdF (DUF218 family)